MDSFTLVDHGARSNNPPAGRMSWSSDGIIQTGLWVPRSLTDGEGTDLAPLLDGLADKVLIVSGDGTRLALVGPTRKGNAVTFPQVVHRHKPGAVYTFTAVPRADWEAERAEARQYRERPALEMVPDLDINGDATIQLTEWLYSLPANTVADFRGQTFVSERPIELVNREALTIRNLRLVREDAEFHGGVKRPYVNSHLRFKNAFGCTVEDVHVTGTNQVSDGVAQYDWTGAYSDQYEMEAAVRFEDSDDVTVRRVVADGVWGDGVQLHTVNGALVEGLTVIKNGRQGITPNGRGIIIRGCNISSRRAGIDLEPAWGSSRFGEVLIEDCTIRSRLLAITSGGGGAFSDVEVRYNTIVGSGVPCINVRGNPGGSPRDRWWIHHNEIGPLDNAAWGVGSPSSAITLGDAAAGLVEHNFVKLNPRGSDDRRRAVALRDRSTATVRHNWFRDASVAVVDRDGNSAFVEHDNHLGSDAPAWWSPVGARERAR